MGLSGASSVLEAVMVGVVPRLSGFGGFPPCGELSSAGPKTATIAEDLPFQRQNDNDSPGRFKHCQGGRCPSAVVGPVTVGPDCAVPDKTWTGPGCNHTEHTVCAVSVILYHRILLTASFSYW